MDWSVAHSLNLFLVHHDGVEDPVLTYVKLSILLWVISLIIPILLARHTRGVGVRRTAVAAGLSAALGLLVGKIITEFYARARPFVAHPRADHLFIAHAPDASFPSDHATAAIAIAVAILLRGQRAWGWVALVFAVILMYGRVALGLHYPTDVLGGAAIGALAALTLYWAPIRRWVDRLSDLFGRIYDPLTDAVGSRTVARSR